MESLYELKYYFECGSGVCLWSKNNKAEDKYGLAVLTNRLPLSQNTICWLNYLVSWYDTSLDWESPPDMGKNWEADEDRFYVAAREGFERLDKELRGKGYLIENGMDL